MNPALDSVKTALYAITDRIPEAEQGVTCKRAIDAVHEAMNVIDRNLQLVAWEQTRIARHVEDRRVRAEAEASERKAKTDRITAIESGKKKKP